MTARTLIAGSLRLIGVLAEGETPTDQEATDALSALNDMLDSFSSERLMIPAVVREVFDVTAGQQTYSMGLDGTPDFNTSRPLSIEDALIVVNGASPEEELPMKIINQNQFAQIFIKPTQSTIQLWLYNDNQNPNCNINLWPVPQINTQIVLYSKKQLASFPTLDTAVSLPPGGNRMLRFNLGVELAPEYGKSNLDPKVVVIAEVSKANFKRANKQPLYMKTDDALAGPRGTFNWLTGDTV